MKTLYKNFNLLDGTKNMTLKPNMELLVENDTITKIAESIEIDEGTRVVDLKGGYLLPGLINTHVHIPANGVSANDPEKSKKLAKTVSSSKLLQKLGKKFLCNKNATTELLSGCTTIRTVGGVGHIDSMIRDDVKKGKILAPRIISCDEAVTIPGGHMEGTVAYGAKDDADFVRFIEENISYGVDWIKIMITGGVLDAKVKGGPGEMRMTPEQVKLCCDTAHAHGVKVCAHVESPAGVVAAIDNGVDSVEHGSELHDEEIKILKERDGALICTLSPAVILARLSDKYTKASEIVIYNSEVLMQQMITGTKTALENDIKVGLGTDTGCPFVTHYDMWRELEYAHRMLEIPREEALYLGTLSNATILGIENETGSVEVGKKADFIVSRENPMEDFRALSQLELVVFEGKEIPNPKPEKFPECEKALDELLNVI